MEHSSTGRRTDRFSACKASHPEPKANEYVRNHPCPAVFTPSAACRPDRGLHAGDTGLRCRTTEALLAGIPVVSAIMGPVHGIAFVAYIWLIFSTRRELGWTTRELARLLIPAFIPFGTFFNVSFLNRKSVALN